jgi:hypothetical protein
LATTDARTGYAPVNDLDMYYEIHGHGRPLTGTSHFVPPGFGLLDRSEWLLSMIPPFLDAPEAEEQT